MVNETGAAKQPTIAHFAGFAAIPKAHASPCEAHQISVTPGRFQTQ
jgi:hypothetical protein